MKLLLSLIDAETHKDFEDYFGNSGEIGSAAVQLRKRSKGQEVKVDGDNDDGSGPTHRSAGVSTAKFVGQKQILSEKNKKLMSFVQSIKGGKVREIVRGPTMLFTFAHTMHICRTTKGTTTS